MSAKKCDFNNLPRHHMGKENYCLSEELAMFGISNGETDSIS